MTDPLALLPLALAARSGRLDEFEVQQLIAAGLTLLQRSAPLVRALSGRRAAILLPTGPEFLVAIAASEGRGAVLINPLASPLEIAYQLADADVGAVFTNGALSAKLPEATIRVLLDDAPRTARVGNGGIWNEIDLGSHFGLSLMGEAEARGSDEEAAVVYTSAMAGVPLGARLSHRSLLANAHSTIDAGGLTQHDHVLALLPFSHLFGLTVTGSAPLLTGASVTTMGRFNPVRAVELLAHGEITMVVGVPAVYGALLAVIARNNAPIRSEHLRLCLCGGAPLQPEMQNRWWDATGTELRQGYGLTEGGPVCLFNHVSLPNRRGTMGVAFPNVKIAIRDPDSGADLPVGSRGEVCVLGENVFSGYVRAGDAGLAVRDGWLHTGDLGEMDSDGYVTFRGLRKAMFTRSGFNIYPREIEQAVAELDGVERVEVRAVPEPSRENDIELTVSGSASESAIRSWCEMRLASYKQPSRVDVTPA